MTTQPGRTRTAARASCQPAALSPTATEYEPMSGEKAIYIFLKGQNRDEQFAYRVTLEGTAAAGYRVLKIDQGMAFPTLSNQKKAFEPPLSVP